MEAKVVIDSPCHEDWNSMSATEVGKYCTSCEKQVYDVTALSQNEIQKLYLENNGSLCVKIQANRVEMPAIKPQKKTHFLRYIAVACLAWWMMAKTTIAKSFNLLPTPDPDERDSRVKLDTMIISGQVLDSVNNNAPLPFAMVRIFKGDTILGGSYADFNGNFKIILTKDLHKDDKLKIEAGYLGYDLVYKTIYAADTLKTNIYIEDSVIRLEQITVTTPSMHHHGEEILGGVGWTMGSMSSVFTNRTRILDPYDTKTYRADEIQNYNFGRD